MGYRFSLATLLRYRESMEHRCWLELQAANQAVRRIENSIVELEINHQEWRGGRIEKLNIGVQAAGLEEWGESYYARRGQQLRAELCHLRKDIETKLLKFSKARQQREILSKMQVRDRVRFENEQARREQARVDELFLIRRSYMSRKNG